MALIKQMNIFICLLFMTINQAVAKYIWSPPVQSTFYYQVEGILNKGVRAQVYFINFLDNQAAVGELRGSGRRVVCNFSIGIYERKTPDSNDIPKHLLGNPVPGKYQASFINIAGYQTSGIGDVMKARIDLAKATGCDAVEFDNYDYYQSNSISGLLINYQIQLDYFKYLAYYAHSVGLGVSLKNNPTQVKDLFSYVDFAVGDICDASSTTCNYMDSFINSNKAAFGISFRENYTNYIADTDWQQLCVQYIYKKYSWIIRAQTQDGYHLRCVLKENPNDNIISESYGKTLQTTVGAVLLSALVPLII